MKNIMKIIIWSLLSLVVYGVYAMFWSLQEIIPGSIWIYFSVPPVIILGLYLIKKNWIE